MIIQNKKAKYRTPTVELIVLDNEISLSLQSFGNDPYEPGMTSQSSPDYFKSDPCNNLA